MAEIDVPSKLELFVTASLKLIVLLPAEIVTGPPEILRMGAPSACATTLLPVMLIDPPPEGPPLVGPLVIGPLRLMVVKPDRVIPPPAAVLLVMGMVVAAPNDPAPPLTMLIVGVAVVVPVSGPF